MEHASSSSQPEHEDTDSRPSRFGFMENTGGQTTRLAVDAVTSNANLVSVTTKDAHPTSDNAAIILQSISDNPWRSLVKSIAGDDFDNADKVEQLLRIRMTRVPNVETRALVLKNVDATFHPHKCELDRTICLLSTVASYLRQNPMAHTSNIVRRLCEEQVFTSGSMRRTTMYKLLFASVGWVTDLYVPNLREGDKGLEIDTEGATCFTSTTIEMDDEIEFRSVIHVLRELGEILPLPDRDIGSFPGYVATPDVLNVASLNIATLIQVGQVQIDWTGSLSSHLDFDTAHLDPKTGSITPVLKLFRYPSLCYQHAQDSSLLTSRWYDEDKNSAKFRTKGFMQEILLSYKLLVQFDSRARKIFTKISRPLRDNGDFDEELDVLCLGMPRQKLRRSFRYEPAGLRETFNAKEDFPIFCGRLIKITRFIDSIQPNRVTSLWKDRRDILRWYTFWAIFILGGINLIVAFVQTSLSAEQVRLAKVSLDSASESSSENRS